MKRTLVFSFAITIFLASCSGPAQKELDFYNKLYWTCENTKNNLTQNIYELHALMQSRLQTSGNDERMFILVKQGNKAYSFANTLIGRIDSLVDIMDEKISSDGDSGLHEDIRKNRLLNKDDFTTEIGLDNTQQLMLTKQLDSLKEMMIQTLTPFSRPLELKEFEKEISKQKIMDSNVVVKHSASWLEVGYHELRLKLLIMQVDILNAERFFQSRLLQLISAGCEIPSLIFMAVPEKTAYKKGEEIKVNFYIGLDNPRVAFSSIKIDGHELKQDQSNRTFSKSAVDTGYFEHVVEVKVWNTKSLNFQNLETKFSYFVQ
jgi:hypothetical protein